MKNQKKNIVMQNILSLILIFIVTVFLYVPKTSAQFAEPNNKFGVHLIEPTDEEVRMACRDLSNGYSGGEDGEGGKLTITVVKGGMTIDTLQSLHNIAREERCQIIHVIKNSFGNPHWKPMDIESFNYFTDLFSKLLPSTKDIIIVVGNEVNRPDESGGTCDPESYAHISKVGIERMKKEIPNVVVSLAGLDSYAPNSNGYCSSFEYMKRVHEAEPELYGNLVDFLTIHEYPNNDMTGSIINIWKREADNLKSLGVNRELPILITELAWKRHRGLGLNEAARRLNEGLLALGNHDEIWAIIYFPFKFCGHPFNVFSTFTCDVDRGITSAEAGPNAVFNSIASVPKPVGEPRHIHKARSKTVLLEEIIENTDYSFEIEIENLGTDLWRGIGGDYQLELIGPPVVSSFSSFYKVRPKNSLNTLFKINTGSLQGCPEFKVAILKKDEAVMQAFDWRPCIVPKPSADVTVKSFPGQPGSEYTGSGEIQIFDANENLVYRKNVQVQNGVVHLDPVEGVRFEELYRIVWLSTGNLPVQITNARFHKGNNEFQMPLLLSLDNNNDGALTFEDVVARFK